MTRISISEMERIQNRIDAAYDCDEPELAATLTAQLNAMRGPLPPALCSIEEVEAEAEYAAKLDALFA